MYPAGRADHDIVLVEYDIKAKRVLQSPRNVFLYKRADMQGLKDHMRAFEPHHAKMRLRGFSNE